MPRLQELPEAVGNNTRRRRPRLAGAIGEPSCEDGVPDKPDVPNVFTNVYDENGFLGHLTSTIEPFVFFGAEESTPAVTEFGYDSRGRQVTVTNPLGHINAVAYDDLDRVIATTDPLGAETKTAYDVVGRVVSILQPLSFDDENNPHPATTAYDALGQVVSTRTPTDATSGHDIVVLNVYDSFGRLTSTNDGVGTTQFGYDAAGKRTSLTDPILNVTHFVYTDGLLTEQIDPFGKSTTYEYDDAGRLDVRIDRNGDKRDFSFDLAGRKTGETWSTWDDLAVAFVPVNTLSYTYDLVGNQLTATTDDGVNDPQTNELEYDALNRVILSTQPSGATLAFTYDEVGNRIRVEDSEGGDEISIYNAGHQLVRRMQDILTAPETAGKAWVDFYYDAAGRQIASMRYQADAAPDDPSAAPTVVGMVVNGGPGVAENRFGDTTYLAGQNMAVVQLLVTFNHPVTLDDDDEAFSLTSLADDESFSAWGLAACTAAVAIHAAPVADSGDSGTGYTQYVLTFEPGDGALEVDNSNSPFLGNTYTRLVDGLWQLNTVGSHVHAGGDVEGATLADHSDVFWSLFGSHSESGDEGASTLYVDGIGLNEIYAAYGGSVAVDESPFYNLLYDWNADGHVDGDDLNAFYYNFGTIWKIQDSLFSQGNLVAFTSTHYDANGRMLDQISANAKSIELLETKLAYDLAGRVVTKTVNGDPTAYSYDASSQLTGETTGGDTTAYEYDDAGNRIMDGYDLAGEEGANANRYATDGTWTFTYDLEGNVTQKDAVVGDMVWKYAYDNLNHLVKAERMTNGEDVDYRIAYTYDAWGNRIAEAEDVDGDVGTPEIAAVDSIQYGSKVIARSSELPTARANQALGDTSVSNGPFNTGAWAASTPDATTEYLSIGIDTPIYVKDVTIYESHNGGFVTKIELIKEDNSLYDFWTGTDSVALTGGSLKKWFNTSDHAEASPFLVKGVKITINGLRAEVTEDDPETEEDDETNDGYEQIDRVKVHGTTPVIAAHDAPTTTTQFVLDGWNPARGIGIGNENFDVRMDLAYNGESSSLTTTYLHGDGVDELYSRNEVTGANAGQYWTLTDNLGSVRAVIDGAGGVVDKIDYDAFGIITAESDPLQRGRFAFTALGYNDVTGLQHSRGREYAPSLGRFMSQDPITFEGGDPNLFRYVHNSPTNATDPSGNEERNWFWTLASITPNPVTGLAQNGVGILNSFAGETVLDDPGELYARGFFSVIPNTARSFRNNPVETTLSSYSMTMAIAPYFRRCPDPGAQQAPQAPPADLTPREAWRIGWTMAGEAAFHQVLGAGASRLASFRAAPSTANSVVARYGSAEQRQFLLNAVNKTGTLREAMGVVRSFHEMRRLGYQLENASLHYRGNQGLDLIFSRAGRFAVVEAKAGSSLSSLRTYAGGLRQGSNSYNINRLQRYLDFGDGTHDALANRLLNEAAAGRLESFAAFYRSGTLFELPLNWPAVPAILR